MIKKKVGIKRLSKKTLSLYATIEFLAGDRGYAFTSRDRLYMALTRHEELSAKHRAHKLSFYIWLRDLRACGWIIEIVDTTSIYWKLPVSRKIFPIKDGAEALKNYLKRLKKGNHTARVVNLPAAPCKSIYNAYSLAGARALLGIKIRDV